MMDHGETQRQIGVMNLMACGAREFKGDADSLTFRVGCRRAVKAYVTVTLEPSDTYKVERVELDRRWNRTVVDELDGVYCDNLGAVVRKMGDRP